MTSSHAARVGRLLDGWEAGSGNLPDRLFRALAELIEQGDLAAGDRLPSERGLAAALSVSRGTVTEAYTRLRDDGRVGSRTGSGSVVMSDHRRETATDARLSTFGSRADELVDLSSGAPGGLDIVVEHARAALNTSLFTEIVAEDGYDVHGLPSLRAALGTYYADLGVPTTQDEVLVTNGSQQALKLLADTLVSRGDTVIVEDPTYRGALEAFRARNARLVPVPVEADGPDVVMLERLVRQLQPRVVYLLPVAHNPTGYVVSPEKKRRIAEIMDGSGSILVEDGSPADLTLTTPAPPTPVGAAMKSAEWIAVGSASKVFWGGLRIGWIRAKESTLHTLVRAKAVEDLGSSLVSQLVTVACLNDLTTARTQRRTHLRHSLTAAVDTLNRHAPEWSWTEPEGGSGLWVRLPGTDTTAFAQTARRNGIVIVPGPVFSAVEGFQDHLRIPFWKPPDELTAGLTRLADLWRATRKQSVSIDRDHPVLGHPRKLL
ncbi:PLP-dependent aminotransferase family protein [Amycolatopsis jejuensis]|uniref:aminotransferase-like domain-containing protein n=1 Tax=Amycolatopsis jejuensis TaxID=330084 RepID=UPI00068F90A7|nr:PLP-dependent aminotransferase family protein [Amycolatopsis jejuensis]